MRFKILILILLCSCSAQRIVRRPVVCTNVYQSVNETVHQFETLFKREYIDCFADSQMCQVGDTLEIILTKKRVIIKN